MITWERFQNQILFIYVGGEHAKSPLPEKIRSLAGGHVGSRREREQETEDKARDKAEQKPGKNQQMKVWMITWERFQNQILFIYVEREHAKSSLSDSRMFTKDKQFLDKQTSHESKQNSSKSHFHLRESSRKDEYTSRISKYSRYSEDIYSIWSYLTTTKKLYASDNLFFLSSENRSF